MDKKGEYVVGLNDNGTYYEVAHLKSCGVGKKIGCRRKYFHTKKEALSHATERRFGRNCCARRAADR